MYSNPLSGGPQRHVRMGPSRRFQNEASTQKQRKSECCSGGCFKGTARWPDEYTKIDNLVYQTLI